MIMLWGEHSCALRGNRANRESATMTTNHIGRHLPTVGSVGVLCSTALGMGCCAPGIIAAWATLVGSVGLGVLLRLDIVVPILYASLAVTFVGLWWSYRSHRNPYPLVLGGIGGLLLLSPFYMALDLSLFFALLAIGVASVWAASLWGTVLMRLADGSVCRPSAWVSRGADRRRRAGGLWFAHRW